VARFSHPFSGLVHSAGELLHTPSPASNTSLPRALFSSHSMFHDNRVNVFFERNKARGNEVFEAGEHAQAVLLNSLSLDKAHELPEQRGGDRIWNLAVKSVESICNGIRKSRGSC
jgi:hypothetical protein